MWISQRASWLWPSLAALLVIALTFSLGVWQLDRAAVKEERARQSDSVAQQPPIWIGDQQLGAEPINYRPVSARGEWLTEYAIYLDNQVHKGQVGFFVYMPLRLEGSDLCVLINRGWIAAGVDRAHLPEIKSRKGGVTINGVVHLSSTHFKELSNDYREGRIWENLTMERFTQWSGLKLQPFEVWQTDQAADGLVRDWVRPDSGADRNRAYAFQWFALAGLTGFLWAYYFFKKETTHGE
ncbi:MAG: SURF1 family protein [Sterolibacterium sp.]